MANLIPLASGRSERSEPEPSSRSRRGLWQLARRLVAFGVLLIASGCADPAPPVPVAPVSGIVKYRGAPVRGAQVKFSKIGCPIVAGGVTAENGEFVLSSYRQEDRAPVGVNRVSLYLAPTAAELEAEEAARAEIDATEAIEDPEERRAKLEQQKNERRAARGGRGRAQPRSQLPGKYATEETSNLSFTVEAGAKNEFEIEITD